MEKEWITVIAYLGFKVHSLRVFCFLHFHHRHYSFLRLASISSILFTVVSHSNLFPQLQRLHVHFFLKLPSIFTLSLLSTTVSFWVLPISPPPPFNVHLYFIGCCPCFLCHILTTHLHNISCCTWPLHHASEKCISDPEQEWHTQLCCSWVNHSYPTLSWSQSYTSLSTVSNHNTLKLSNLCII